MLQKAAPSLRIHGRVRASRSHDPVFAGALGEVHRLVCAHDGVGAAFAALQLGHACAEGDEHFFGALQKEAGGEFALKACHGGNAAFYRGVGQDHDEFFAAVAGQQVLRAHDFAGDLGQVHQGGVAACMAQPVVDGLEVVHIQKRQAQRRSEAAGARDFALHGFVQAFAVERSGQGVVPGLGAGAVQLFLQFGHFGALGFGALAQVFQFFVGDAAVQGHGAGGAHHLLQHRGDFFEGGGFADQVGTALHGALVAGAGGRDLGQPLDERGQHVLHLLLGFERAGAGLGLLEDHVLEPPLHVVQAPQGQRRGGRRHECFGLALQPAVVGTEHGDVLEHHVQQLEQGGADGGLVFGGKRYAVGKVAQHLLRGGQGGRGLAQKAHELLRHIDHAGVVVAQRGQGVVDQACQGFRELGGQCRGRALGCRRVKGFDGFGGGGGLEPQVGIAHHHALQGSPVFGDDGPLELTQKALLGGCLGGQHPLDAAQRAVRKGLGAARARDFVVQGQVVVGGGGESPRSQLLQRFAGYFGGLSFDHVQAPVSGVWDGRV